MEIDGNDPVNYYDNSSHGDDSTSTKNTKNKEKSPKKYRSLSKLQFEFSKYETTNALINADSGFYDFNFGKNKKPNQNFLLETVKQYPKNMPCTPKAVKTFLEINNETFLTTGKVWDVYSEAVATVIEKGLKNTETALMFHAEPKFLKKMRDDLFNMNRNVQNTNSFEKIEKVLQVVSNTIEVVGNGKITEKTFLKGIQKNNL